MPEMQERMYHALYRNIKRTKRWNAVQLRGRHPPRTAGCLLPHDRATVWLLAPLPAPMKLVELEGHA